MSREQVERPITGLSGKDKFKYIYVATDETEEINLALCGCGHKKKRTTWEVKDSQTRGKSDSRERMKEISLDSVREAAHPTLGGQVTRPVTFLVVSVARGYYWDIPWSGGTENTRSFRQRCIPPPSGKLKQRVCGAASVVDEVHSPGPHVPSAVRRVVGHAVEQNAVHLRYVLRAQTGVWGALSANTRLHTHSDGRWRRVTD